MEKSNQKNFISLLSKLLLVAVIASPVVCLAAEPTVNLRSTTKYAILAGSTITNTGPSVIKGSGGGSVGLHPGTAFTGQAYMTISGSVQLANAEANTAKNDLILAYDDAAGRTSVTRIGTELGGVTLIPGVYDSADGTFEITGTLTLDGQGNPDSVFIFKTESTIKTAAGSVVKLIGSAQSCHVFWQVGTSATLGVNSNFVGHIFALASITATTGAKIDGQLLARNGAVTLDTNTITNSSCIGFELPDTSTPLYKILLGGLALMAIGVVGFTAKKRHE